MVAGPRTVRPLEPANGQTLCSGGRSLPEPPPLESMKRPMIILLAGLFLALAAYGIFYFRGKAVQHELLKSEAPELLWLKQEFHLADSEFTRIAELHRRYLPDCRAMC